MHHGQAVGLEVAFDAVLRRRKTERLVGSKGLTIQIPVLCIVGFSLYLGWIFCLFWSPSLFPCGVYGDFVIHTIRMVMTIAMFVAYVAFGLGARFFSLDKGEIALRAVALVCCPCACAVGLFPGGIGFLWCCALWAIGGIGSSALLLVWSKKLIELDRRQVVFTTSVAFLGGSFLFMLIAFVPSDVSLLLTASIPLASVVAACMGASSVLTLACVADAGRAETCHSRARRKELFGLEEQRGRSCSSDEESERASSKSSGVAFARTALLAFAYSICVGFIGSCATSEEFYPSSVYAIVAGNACAAVFALLFLMKKSRDATAVLIEAFLPVMLLCLFVFSFSGRATQLLCIALMLALLACHDIMDMVGISKSLRLFDENYVRAFAAGRTLNGLGCSLGWAVGMVFCFLPGIGVSGRLFVCFATTVFLVLVSSFAVFHPGAPFFFAQRACPDSSSTSFFTTGVVSNGSAMELSAKVKGVAERFSLTSRQAEVLLCLAQGRNAGYISQKFTISTHTAKSHIYNIYNKLGIHSQQELLDIVDAAGGDASLPDESPSSSSQNEEV